MALPERHLGLVQAQEIDDLERRLQRAAVQIAATELAELPPSVAFAPAWRAPLPAHLAGVRIAIARDRAFSFLYPANVECLQAMGAELVFFSPLADEPLPPADAVYLPGGYPELHLDVLAANRCIADSLRAHVAAGKPLYAECGGMLYLLERLSDADGRGARLLGLLPGQARMQRRLAGLGLLSVELDGGTLRGHTFHYSRLESPLAPLTEARRVSGAGAGEAVYRRHGMTASYLHAYFPSCPEATARLFLPAG